MATLDFRGQFFSENRHLLAFRRPHVRRQPALYIICSAQGSEQKQIGQFSCAQPRETVSVLDAPQCKTPVAIDSVPAEVRDFNALASHRFDRV